MGNLSFMLSKVFISSSDELGKSTQELCWAAVTIAVDARRFEHSMVVTEISWICCHGIPHVDIWIYNAQWYVAAVNVCSFHACVGQGAL